MKSNVDFDWKLKDEEFKSRPKEEPEIAFSPTPPAERWSVLEAEEEQRRIQAEKEAAEEKSRKVAEMIKQDGAIAFKAVGGQEEAQKLRAGSTYNRFNKSLKRQYGALTALAACHSVVVAYVIVYRRHQLPVYRCGQRDKEHIEA